ncbi:MAG: hypothetical protein QM726_12925 [Chitinophagaceae bacterium]
MIKQVTQIYYNLDFTPESVKKTNKSIDISVTPIDAKSLNKETYEAALRDGNYEKEFYTYIEKWKSDLRSQTKHDRILTQGKINAFDLLGKLEKEGSIPKQISITLKRKIANETIGKDGTEIESLGDIDLYPSEFNPYKGETNYFSVFKITFDNKSEAIDKVNLKEFQIISNEEQLYPLASEYFEKNLEGHTESIKNSYRMNMPSELTVTPGQRINKYIAVPAININNKKLQVQLIRGNIISNFDFIISKKEIEKKYNLERYELVAQKPNNLFRLYFVISYKDNISYPLKDNKLFVSDEKKNLKASVYSIAINGVSSEVAYGTITDFTFSDSKSPTIKIPINVIKKDKKTGTY